MKRILAMILTVCLAAMFVPFAANAQTDLYSYYVENGEAIIDSVDASISGNIVIPSSLGGYPVKEIAWEAFYGCEGITSIVIPDSVTYIGNAAFSECINIESITIGKGADYIESTAFTGCVSLASITVDKDNSVYHSVGNCIIETETGILIQGCNNSVIPNDGSITEIGSFAFEYCDAIESIVIPDGVTYIGFGAFSDCVNLKSITIPDSVTEINDFAFDNTAYYNDEANWENGVLYIGKHLISATEELSGAYKIKEGTKTIAGGAFFDCNDLTDVTVPTSIVTIGGSAFDDCESLKNITINDGVSFIGIYAFSGCVSLESVVIPASVTCIDIGIFSRCSSLTSITVDKDNPVYHSAGNCIIETETGTLVQGCNNSVIPDDGSVSKIGWDSFYYCEKLETIVIPNGVTSIESYAFDNCTNLKSVVIPESVKYISDWAFVECESLENAYFKNTENWSVVGEALASADLADPAKAAEYLTETYLDYLWTNDTIHSGDLDGVGGVDANDAIYLLYHVFFGDERYPVDQACDYDGNDTVEAADAIYLLYHVFFGAERYPLN